MRFRVSRTCSGDPPKTGNRIRRCVILGRVPRIMWCQPVKNPATVRTHLGKRLIVGPQNKRLGYSLFQLLPEYLIPS